MQFMYLVYKHTKIRRTLILEDRLNVVFAYSKGSLCMQVLSKKIRTNFPKMGGEDAVTKRRLKQEREEEYFSLRI
jgi:hypothetical protein